MKTVERKINSVVRCSHCSGEAYWVAVDDGDMPIIWTSQGKNQSVLLGLAKNVVLVACSMRCLKEIKLACAQQCSPSSATIHRPSIEA